MSMNTHDNYTVAAAISDALGFAFMWAAGAETETDHMSLGPIAFAYAMEDTNSRPTYPGKE